MGIVEIEKQRIERKKTNINKTTKLISVIVFLWIGARGWWKTRQFVELAPVLLGLFVFLSASYATLDC